MGVHRQRAAQPGIGGQQRDQVIREVARSTVESQVMKGEAGRIL